MDRYIRVKKIGEGAFGKAILVKNKDNGKQCVIKEISLGRMGPKEREDSRKEVAVLAQLNHPNIVTYLESFEEKGTLYICMDYCAGGDLYSKINQQRGTLMTEEQIWSYFAQICLAVKHIHDRKILHRDIKSQNIFLTGEGRVKIGDFGIAKVLNSTMELARTCIGTPYYLSPELVENLPYNNKSDVWSLGCVLYEMTTLKHAFEAGNMKNLVLKIIRGVYPPIPPKYSYELRGIIAQLFKRSPRDRPSINALLRKNIMMQKVRNLLSDDKLAEEFSHTIMHGKKIARALPPPPRPGSARPASANSRPGSAAKRSVSKPAQSNSKYNPANIYGQPLVKKSNEKRAGVDVKKKSGAGRIVPGQADWEKKRIELRDREKQRREEEKQKEQEYFAKQHKEFIQKQKIAQINRSREAGWNNLIDPPSTPKQPEVEVRQPPPPQRAPVAVPRKPDFRVGGDKGNYDHYNAYLDKIQQDRINRIREGGPVPLPRPAAIPYMQAPPEAAPPKRLGREQFQFNRGAGQGAEDRRAMAEAAERNRLAEEFLNRKKEAALNKARGRAEIYGNRPSSAGVQRAATPKQQVKPGAAVSARNREEQDYLSQLRKIREQNMRERKMLQGKKDPDNADLGKYKPPLDEDRRKKMEALKKQADDWANRNKEESEKAKKDLIALRRNLEDQAKSRPPSRNAQSRPGSANNKPAVVMKPAAAVPITGVLQAIGATDDNNSKPTPDNKEVTRQQQKENILKRLNEKQNPGRSKWVNPDGTFIPAFGDDEEVASSARSQWEDGQQVKLSDLPLEQTSSQMEATNAGDQVIRSPDGKIIRVSAAAAGRQEWGRPGSTILNALQGLPIDGTMASTVSGGSDDSRPSEPTSPPPPINIVSGIGATITVNKPLIREGTITIKSAEESANNKDSLPVAPSLSDQNIEDIKTALSVIGELEEFSPNKEPDNKSTETDEPSKNHDEIKSNIVQSNTEIDTTCNDNQSETSSQIDAILIKQSEITSADGESNNQPNTFTQIGAISVDQSESISAVNESVTTSNDLQDSSVEKQGTRQSVAERLSNNFSKDNSTETTGKPAIPKKPYFEFKKPVLLPKPDLSAAEFAKPVIAPFVINSKGEGDLFSRVQLDDDDESEDNKSPQAVAKPDVIQEQNGKMVAKGLTTGNFDIGNVKMLRTCSEPDLSKLFETGEKNPTPPLTRHLSLDRLNTVQEEVDDDLESVKQSLSEIDIYSPRSDTSQPKSDDNNTDNQPVENDDNGDDEDGDDEDEDDDDDDDIINVRATMQSLLIDDDDDDEENEDGVKVDFKLSDTSQNKCKSDAGDNSDGSDINIENDESENNDDGNNETEENDDDEEDDKDEKEDENSDEDDNKGHITHSQSDSVLSRHSSHKSDTFSDLFAGDSDGETTFGDDDNDDNDEYDVYGRLEEARAELEEVLGFDLFIKVYKAIQALQEDEDENVEEGTKIAIEILGKENEKYYPKIFQLVMSDTAFTEDNA